MAKAQTERRQDYGDIFIALAEIKKDTGQIFSRLDKINGCVQEYVENKHKWDDQKEDMELLATRIKVVEEHPKICEDRFIGKKLFTSISLILGVLITVFALLNYFSP